MTNIEAIPFLAPVSEPSLLPSVRQGAAPSAQFGPWFTQQLSQVNDQLTLADRGVRQLAAGEPVDMHNVMIDLEKAKMSLQLMMQIRTTVLESYQEVMRMSI
jgi:flagellar hook-basal body complex protein FliE